MIAIKYSFAAGAAVVAMLAACGDEVTEVTNVNEKASLDMVEKYNELPKCEESIYGSLVYAADSSQVYACTSDGWGSLKGDKGDKGDDGKAGENDKNGEKGADGKDGSNGEDGEDGKDGTSCTATKLKDGSGIEVMCGGKTVGTITNGTNGENGADGTNCVSEDYGNGVVTVICGDAAPVSIYKAMCGIDSFDPEKKFCVLGKLYDKCGGKAYIVNREYCKDGVVEELCTEVNRKEDGSYEVVANRALSEDEFCLAGIVTKKCVSKEFSMNEFCGKTMDGKVDSILTFCKNPDDERLESAYQLIGKSIFPTDEDDAAFSSSSLFGNLIGPKLDDFTGDDLKKFYDALENLKTSCEEIP